MYVHDQKSDSASGEQFEMGKFDFSQNLEKIEKIGILENLHLICIYFIYHLYVSKSFFELFRIALALSIALDLFI